MTKITLDWIEDPGHGWLIIPRDELRLAGMTEADISPYSYQSGDMLALEEDCDAGAFISRRWPTYGREDFKHEVRHIEHGGPRNWRSFGSKKYEFA